MRLRADGSSLGEPFAIEGLEAGGQVSTSWSDVHPVLLFHVILNWFQELERLSPDEG